MKKYVKSSDISDLDFSEDYFLPLEHQIDLSIDAAWELFRLKRTNPMVSDQARNIATELEKIKKRIRNLRSFTFNYGE